MSITYNTGNYARGRLSDLRYATYNTGGTVRTNYYLTANLDIFDDSPTVDDFMHIYVANVFEAFTIDFNSSNIPIAGTDVVLAYEYYNGTAWTALPGLTDGTSNLSTSGTISWTVPDDWELVSRSTDQPLNTSSASQFCIRVRLVSFTTITEGGYISSGNYPGITQKYIYVSGETFSFEDIYDADVAGGWGVITKDYNNFYCSVGFLPYNSTWNETGGTIQIGGERSKGVMYSCSSNVEFNWNLPTIGRALAQSPTTNLILGTRGVNGTIYIYPSAGSIIQNTSFKALDEEFYCRLALRTVATSNIPYWNNCIFSKVIVYDGHYFNRINFNVLEYILTNGLTVYDNCNYNCPFSCDQGNDSVVKRGVLGSRTTDTYWRSGSYSTTATLQNRFQVISATWDKPSIKYCNYGKNLSSRRDYVGQQYIDLLANFVQLKTQDKDRNDVTTKVYITDQYGNNAAWEDTDLEIRSGSTAYFPQSATDTTLELVDATGVSVDDQYLVFGEIFTVESISGNILTISRGDESSARRIRATSNKNSGLAIYKRVPYLTCAGSLEDIYLIDALFHKYSVDGGTTTTGHLERYYGDYTISVEAEGYETQQYIGNITDELFLNLTMRPQKQIATTQDGVFINTDPSDLTDDLNLIKI